MRLTADNNRAKTALVLAGGGLTGAVYEIGALRAINDLLTDRTVNDFDVYVGTSAGALVGSMLANGIAPEVMLQALSGHHPDIRAIARSDVFYFNPGDLLQLSLKLPKTLIGAWSHYLRYLKDMTLFDLIWSLSEALPTGMYDSRALERYIRHAIVTSGGSNRFADLKRDLCIIATDLDSSQRVVFGCDSNQDVPISLAVAASTAVPLLYKPVRIADHDYIDGGVRGNASLDIAIEHGATLVICINPLVPFDNSDRASIPFLGSEEGLLADKGLTAIASQVTRIQNYAGLIYHIKQLRKTHPEVDIILIEPDPKDAQMSFSNIMRYSTRLTVAQHGYETVTLKLAESYHDYAQLLSRHGIVLNPRLLDEQLAEIQAANHDPQVIRRILETQTAAPRRRGSAPVRQLNQTLAELDEILNQLSDTPQARRGNGQKPSGEHESHRLTS
jgi:NTE family protein